MADLDPKLNTERVLEHWPTARSGEEALYERLRAVCEEGLLLSNAIVKAREGDWHSFIPADYGRALSTLREIEPAGARFLEFGSGTGVITIMADLLGLDACGIEIAPELVTEARALARRHGSTARFATGSFLPTDYEYVSENGDKRLGTVGIAEPAYAELGADLTDFDWIYAYPWPGEAAVIRHLVTHRASSSAGLILHNREGGFDVTPPTG